MALSAEPLTDPMIPQLARVVERREEAPGVVTLWLDLPGWQGCAPGQFNMLGRPGVGEVAISVSGGAATSGRVMHTIRAVGAVSAALCAAEPGAVLTLRGPFGVGWPVEEAQGDAMVVAGGLGLAPLRPAIEALLARPEGRLTLCYGMRSPADRLFVEDLTAWAEQGMTLRLTADQAEPGWTGRVGVVTGLIDAADFDGAGAAAFVCGPEIMMRFGANTLTDAGLPPDRVFVSMERNMQCGIGLCGHCQLGPVLVCRDGPVLPWDRAQPLMRIKEL